MKKANYILLLSTLILSVLFISIASHAVAPSPEVIQKWKEEGTYQKNIQILKNFKANGGCAPVEQNLLKKRSNLALGSETVDTVRVIVLLVDFLDYKYTAGPAEGTAQDFDSILFSDSSSDTVYNPTGSMTDFYMENSYGNFYIIGDIFGWYTVPHNYSYYTQNSDFGLDPNGYPNARNLADDAILWATLNPEIDFKNYDHNNDSICDGVIIIHAGPGGERTGNTSDIWSHNWTIPNVRYDNDVRITNYNMNPEEDGSNYNASLSPIGVFCHEYGHFIGLPDLYDTDDNEPTSNGLGRWSLMASGNYNGGSRTPAHLDPWCKIKLGFIQPIALTQNIYRAEIPQVEHNPVVYKLQNAYSGSQQYWLVENRQRVGFDAGLPGAGLLIYHIDDTQNQNNNYPLRYRVALEQADGLDALAFAGSEGDGGDPYPGAVNNRNFNQYTTPNSKTYNGVSTRIAVWDISNSDSLMYADLDIEYSRPWFSNTGVDSVVFDDVSLGDGDGVLDPGETIKFYFRFNNFMRESYNIHASLTSTSGEIEFTVNNVNVPGTFTFLDFSNASYPIEFVLPDSLTPVIDSFYLTVSTDSLNGIPGGEYYTREFGYEATLGHPNIIIIDDDNGGNYENAYSQAFYDKRVPTSIWKINSQGHPTALDLEAYDMVFWMTGDTVSNNNMIDANDISSMKDIMDNGLNLCLSSVRGIKNMNAVDPTFMSDYFKASYSGTDMLWPIYTGVNGSPVSDGMQFFSQTTNFMATNTFDIIGEGQPIMTISPTQNICGVAYDGSYKSVLLSMPIEFIDDNRTNAGFNTKADIIGKIVDYFGGITTAVYDGFNLTELPKSFELQQNYPNPFNPSTIISYTVRSTESFGEKVPKTRLEIFNLLGQQVKTLVDEVQIPGNYQVEWDGTDNGQNRVATGVYFYRLSRGEFSEAKKMVLIK